MKIHYEPHPVSAVRKAELIAQGLKIVDARFAPENWVSEAGTSPDLDQLRADYKELIGKRPFHGWDAATIQAKIDEALNVTDN